MSDQTVHPENRIPQGARGYDRFPGRIGRTAAESQHGWPREARARTGAPNIVVVLVDDMGFSDTAPFGSEIATPVLDRLADTGYRFTNYHSTPLCSPSRAALLTGLNPHRVGFGTVSNYDPGFPGMNLALDDDVLTLPEILRSAGYATFALGKWHLTRDALMHDGAEKSSWPCQRGFDRYYGTLEACNSFFHPNRLVSDNTPVDVAEFPEGYYLTDDLTDRAVEMIKGLRANDPTKPFFLYFAHHAMHGPLGAKPDDIARYRGRYDRGWDELREERHRRQIEAGIFPAGTPLPDRGGEKGFPVAAWDELTEEQRALYARYMEVYAAMVDNVDQSLGRIVDTLTALGELDNTIIVFASDNGGTGEGGEAGTRSYFSSFLGIANVLPKDVPASWELDAPLHPDLIGGPRAMVHYPRGWGMVSNTPFRYYKSQTFAGGVRVPLLVSWPAGLPRGSGDTGLRTQYQYVTDLLPTLLDLAGATAPGERHGVSARAVDGASFGSVLREPRAPSTHPEQYSESGGNRGFYRDGWKLLTNHEPGTPFDDGEWELYHVDSDPNELVDRSADEPGLVKELADAWERAAWANTVFPLVGRPMPRRRRPSEDQLGHPVRILPGTPKLERYRSSRLIDVRSFTLDVDLSYGPGDEGVLVAHGDQGGGYSLYVEDGAVHLAYNEYGALTVASAPLRGGERAIRLVADALPELKWRLRLVVDGREAAELPQVWMLLGFAPFSGIDVGINRGGPVSWPLYERRGSFPYRGDLRSVTYTPGARAAYDAALLSEAERRAALVYD